MEEDEDYKRDKYVRDEEHLRTWELASLAKPPSESVQVTHAHPKPQPLTG